MKDKINITVSRRRLTEYLIGLVFIFLSSGVVATVLKYLWPKTVIGTATAIKIAAIDELKTELSKKFLFNGKAAVLLKRPTGYKAFGAVCTHLGCVAYWKPDESIVFCPCHLGKFNPDTGAVISGPPPSPLPEIDIEIKEGEIYANKWKDPDYVRSISFYAGAA